jgi:hypothetical protein
MISPLGENAGFHLSNLTTDEGGFFDAEEYVEKLSAPAVGQVAALTHGPIVEANLELHRTSDNFLYILGLDYFETSYGIENIRIPEGTTLRAEYMYHGEPSIDEGGGVQAASAPETGTGAPAVASGRVGYATMVKAGF